MNNTADVEAAYRAINTSGLLHIHQPIPQCGFVEEWSQYDAGLLHVPKSDDPFRTLNIPNRYSAYSSRCFCGTACRSHAVTNRHLEELGATIIYQDPAELSRQLPFTKAVAKTIAV